MSHHLLPKTLLLTTLAAGTLAAAASATAATAADAPVEGYRSADGRVACVLLRDYDAAGNAVECGTATGTRGVLLPSSGAARAKAWSWPADTLGSSLFTARTGRTLFLSGGTAKLTGTDATLRCTFAKPTAVTCLNASGRGLVVTPKAISVVTPLSA